MRTLIRPTAVVVTAILTCLSATTALATDWSGVEAALGRKASVQPGDVHKFGFPRTDLDVTLDGVKIQPAFALGSWLAFKPVGDRVIVMGDLVLLEDEISPVMERLAASGIDVTALHNHLLRARPFPMYMHVMAEGDAVTLAKALRKALEASNTPFGAVATHAAPPNDTVDIAALDRILGRQGSPNGAGYHFGIPRAETITIEAEHPGAPEEDEDREHENAPRYIVIPPSMGTGIGINFQPTGGGNAAITGDLVLRPDEVNPVLRTLKKNGIEVTALHTHMLEEVPQLYFMHFWANGNAEGLARGLKAALDEINVK
jgi:hypothetical protein